MQYSPDRKGDCTAQVVRENLYVEDVGTGPSGFDDSFADGSVEDGLTRDEVPLCSLVLLHYTPAPTAAPPKSCRRAARALP